MKNSMKKIGATVLALVLAATTLPTQNAKAAEVGSYELSDTKVNTNYDVTGDGVKDKIEFDKINHNGSYYCALDVKINGEVALNVEDTEYGRLEPVFIQTKDHGYILICAYHDNDYQTISRIYEYVDGKLKERMNLDNIAGKVYYQYSSNVYATKEDYFQIRFDGQTNMLAKTKMIFKLKVGTEGKLSVANKTVAVYYSNKRMSDAKNYTSKYLTAAKKIQAYRSSTGTKKAFSIKKGTKLKITKVSVQGSIARYYCVTKSGKKGWIKSKINLFKDLMYAG